VQPACRRPCPHFAARPALIDAWPTALSNTLAELAQLQPLEKKKLVEGLERCVAHDGKLSVEEGELLRTLCAVLNCPLPPLLGESGWTRRSTHPEGRETLPADHDGTARARARADARGYAAWLDQPNGGVGRRGRLRLFVERRDSPGEI
jgi:hypothetical protein